MTFHAATNRPRALLALLALVFIVCCSSRPATQFVVRVDADPSLVAELSRVEVTAFLEGQESRPIVGDAGYDLARYSLPGELVIASADEDEARRLVVRVTGVLTGAGQRPGRVK